jgi:hypothetical protein
MDRPTVADATRDVELMVAKLSAVVSAAGTSLYLVLGVEPSAGAGYLLSLVPVLTVVMWLERDAQRTRVGAVMIWGCFS